MQKGVDVKSIHRYNPGEGEGKPDDKLAAMRLKQSGLQGARGSNFDEALNQMAQDQKRYEEQMMDSFYLQLLSDALLQNIVNDARKSEGMQSLNFS
mmetsp:Transcript_5777/g.9902  ORF Transcript_5777/g.9902 Transcript_5777/m.9902 type:complete len:96 (-) Transcript_5777:1101-1388(-)